MGDLDLSSVVLQMSIEWGGELDDARPMAHEVSFCIVGTPQTKAIGIVHSDPVQPPFVARCVRRGDLDLDDALLHEIILRCFARLGEELVRRNALERSASLRETAEWLMDQFSTVESFAIFEALRRFSRHA